jgi:hypothetical protein
VTRGRRPPARPVSLVAAGIAIAVLSAAADAQMSDTTAAPAAPAGFALKGYLNARYVYVGSSSAATVYSGMRMTGSLRLSALSERVAITYRSHHWLSLRHTASHGLESPFENRDILQAVALETDGLLAAGLKTRLGRFFPGMSYGSSPVIDGGALAYERSGFTIGGAAGRPVDVWNGTAASRDMLAAGQLQYRTERVRMSAGYQTSSYLAVRQKEAPAGISVFVSRHVWAEAYGAYDFAFRELARGGVSLSLHADRGGIAVAATQWRNPFDQLYLADRSRSLPYWGLDAKPVPATYNDLRVSGSYGRGRWAFRGTLGVMDGVRHGWTASGYLAVPPFRGFHVSAGAQGMVTDYIDFYSLDATATTQVRDLVIEVQSQTRTYVWRPRSSGLRDTDNYSELSVEYPLRRHLFLSAAAGGFIRKVGNEGFKPQAELRFIARL